VNDGNGGNNVNNVNAYGYADIVENYKVMNFLAT